MGRLSANVQAVMRANACRCPPYRGTNVSRYAPTGSRPVRYPDRRYNIWWPRENPSPRLENRFNIAQVQKVTTTSPKSEEIAPEVETEIKKEEPEVPPHEQPTKEPENKTEVPPESPPPKKEIVVDNQLPSTSAALAEGARKKRLYSTVLSMTPPPPLNLNACLRLSQKLAPGLIKLNPKLVLGSRIRPNVENKYEELEKEALEQYKASDESIDTKFRELEEQAADQYSTSNSNTSCSSGGNNSGDKKTAKCSPNTGTKAKTQHSKFPKDKSVDSVMIYSQKFPNHDTKNNTNRVKNLKNFHTPPRGEKKEQTHRSGKCAKISKIDSQRPASDTDYEARESNTKGHKGAMRWTLHVMPPKKRHLTSCVSDFSSDEELEEVSVSIRDAGPCKKNRATGKVKMSAHGAGDLHPIMRKS